MLAMCMTVLMWAFTIFLIVGTLAFIFGNDDENENYMTENNSKRFEK